MRYFWLAFAMVPPSLALNGIRWYFVLRSVGFKISFWRICGITVNSTALSIFPGRLGDLARSYPLRNEVPIHHAIGTIILEKIIDVCVLIGLAGLGFLMIGKFWGAALSLLIAIAMIPALIVFGKVLKHFIGQTKIFQKISDTSEILIHVRQHKYFFGLVVLTSVVNMSLSILAFYWLLKAVNVTAPLAAVFAYLPFSIFAGLLPLTLAGTGTRDVALIYFFRSYALPSQSLSAGILFALQGYWILVPLTIPLLYFFFKDSRRD